jgi:superfamily I DNA/RNA helicase
MRTIIPGPPGTGKTYHLINHYLKKEVEEYKTSTYRIAYITFSNAATNEALKRIGDLFPKLNVKKDFPNVRTMHKMGTKELRINTSERLLKGSKWKAFKNFSKICSDISFEQGEYENGMPAYQGREMKIIEHSRSKKISLLDSAIELDYHHFVNIDFIEQVSADLKSYKEQTGMIEFSDMINEFVKKDKCPPLDVVFLDEAQDLSPLQWDMFFYIESKCKRSYIAGDDDQTIYSFQGADADIFINLEGTLDARTQSRRVPKVVLKKALSILPHITKRREKVWLPRDAEGKVFENYSLENIDFTKGNWMILSITNEMMRPVVEHLNFLNIRFDCKYNDLLPKQLLEAYRVWVRLNQGATVGGEEAMSIYEYLSYDMGHTKRGFSSGDSLQNIDTVDLDELMLNHGLLISGSWEQLKIKEQSKLYIKKLLESGEDLFKEARIKVSTIHGVKGEQCDNVVLFTDLTKKIYDEAQKNADPLHRTFFVGITRTKENLYIMQPTEEYYYTIGDPIL